MLFLNVAHGLRSIFIPPGIFAGGGVVITLLGSDSPQKFDALTWKNACAAFISCVKFVPAVLPIIAHGPNTLGADEM